MTCYERTCPQCGCAFKSSRAHAVTDTDACRYQRWIQQQVEAAPQRVSEHPLAEARAAQEASRLKSQLSELVYQGIIARLSEGKTCHADDLEPIFPPEHRDLCRKLTGAQFGSLASRRYIVERERRKSAVPSRKGAKSGVFEFTRLGREKLVGVSASASLICDAPAFGVAGEVFSASGDPGEQSATRVSAGDPSPKGPDRSTNPPVPSASVDSGEDSPEGPTHGTSHPSGESARPSYEPLSLLPGPDPKAWAA